MVVKREPHRIPFSGSDDRVHILMNTRMDIFSGGPFVYQLVPLNLSYFLVIIIALLAFADR